MTFMRLKNQHSSRQTARKTISALAILSLIFSFALLGCSEKPIESANDSTIGSSDLADLQEIKDRIIPEELQARYPESHPIWEALKSDQRLDNWSDPQLANPLSMSDTYHDIYSVRMIWGNLRRDSSSVTNAGTNWDGRLTHNSASMLAVNSLIDFEHGQDSIFRIDAPGFGWGSRTNGGIDGIHFTIFHPKDVVYITAPVFQIRTAQVSVKIHLGDFEKLDTVIVVGHDRALAIIAHRVRNHDCPKGHLAGAWNFKTRREGHFFGRWISSDGQLMGHIRAEFNTTEDGHRVFRGKWWDTEGNWQGYTRGRWGFDPEVDTRICLACPDIVGWFRGGFTDTENNLKGKIGGLFGRLSNHDTDAVHGGHFIGRWEVDCSGGHD